VDKVGILEIALTRLPKDHKDRALVLASLCKELVFGSSLQRRQELAEEAIAIARSSGDDAAIVRVLNHISEPLLVPPLIEQSEAWTADAVARAERVGDPVLLYWAASYRSLIAHSAGDIDELDRCFEITGVLAEQLNQPILNWLTTYRRATRAAVDGDTDKAEQLATEALQIGTDSGEPDVLSVFGAQLLTVHFQRGSMGDLVPLLEQVSADNPGAQAVARAVMAAAHAEGDRTDEAHGALEAVASRQFDLPLDMLWSTGMTMYAEAAIECRDPLYAAPLFDRLAPWGNQWAGTGASVEGPISLYVGGLATVLGRYDEADASFARSAAMSERFRAKFFAARTELSWGRMLAERRAPGDTDKARDLLEKAHTTAVAHGYGTIRRRAAHTLQLLDT
ncbi:MAG: hypothetical protein ABSG81_15930, partial [Acidimicrobiales bacterium]